MSSPSSSPSGSPSASTSSRKSSRPASIVVETLGAKTSETKDGLRKINNYLLKKEIGRGAFGTVHYGIDINTNAEYVSRSSMTRPSQVV